MRSPTEAVIDIETYPDIPEALYKRMCANLKRRDDWKDEKKIEEDLERKRNKLIEDAALNSLTARVEIVGIGIRQLYVSNKMDPQTFEDWTFYFISSTHASLLFTSDSEESEGPFNEHDMLTMVDEFLVVHDVVRLITFNGVRFDLPFLAARAMINRLNLSFKWPLGKYHSNHIDLFEILGRGKLEEWALALFGEGKEHSGSEIKTLIDEGRWEEAEEHCLWDVRNTARIYDLLNQVADRRK